MKVGVIGGGNMGYAYVQSIWGANISRDIIILEPFQERADFLKQDNPDLTLIDSPNEQLKGVELVILAVKPQMFPGVANEIKDFLNKEAIVISIMAGTSIKQMSELLDMKKVVRAMPNTPCQLGEGVTGFYENSLTAEEKVLVQKVFDSNGVCVEVEKEEDLNEVTALSGSGPAYWFTILKHMADAGVSMGLTEEQSLKLVINTMKGAYELVKASDSSLDDLIKAVKSKGGTTEAALNSFADSGLDVVITKALRACRDRSIELSKLS